MQIGTSQFFDRTAGQLATTTAQADRLQTQISTGKRIDRPSQDAVAYNRLSGLKQANADDKTYGGNITLAQSLLTQSDGTLTSIESQLQRAQELTVQAANGTLSDANRKTIASQLQGVLDDLVSLANTTDTRGQPLFGAATGTTAVTRASDGSVSFTGTGEPAAIPIADGTDVHATDSAARVFGGLSNGAGGTTDVFAVLSSFVAALNAGGNVSTAAASAATGLGAAVTQVTAVHGSVGARAARLDLESARLTDTAANREIERGGLEDTDMSTAITELQKTITILQATQASLGKLGQLSLFDYLR